MIYDHVTLMRGAACLPFSTPSEWPSRALFMSAGGIMRKPVSLVAEKDNLYMKHYRYYDLVMALFVTVLLVSNLLSSAKIIDMGVSIGPLALIFDAGTLLFPISYIFGDILTEVYGYQRSRRVIWAGFFANALMALFVW